MEDKDLLDYQFSKPVVLEKFNWKPVIYWCIPISTSIIFILMHWPYGYLILYASTGGLQAYCLVGFLRNKQRNAFNTIISLTLVLWLISLFDSIPGLNNILKSEPYTLQAKLIVMVVAFLFYWNRAKKAYNTPEDSKV